MLLSLQSGPMNGAKGMVHTCCNSAALCFLTQEPGPPAHALCLWRPALHQESNRSMPSNLAKGSIPVVPAGEHVGCSIGLPYSLSSLLPTTKTLWLVQQSAAKAAT